MLIPFSWLSHYVDITLDPDELAHRLTMGGIEVGDVFTRGGWDGCVVGIRAGNAAASQCGHADALRG